MACMVASGSHVSSGQTAAGLPPNRRSVKASTWYIAICMGRSSGLPERLVAFKHRIDAREADILERPVVECKQRPPLPVPLPPRHDPLEEPDQRTMQGPAFRRSGYPTGQPLHIHNCMHTILHIKPHCVVTMNIVLTLFCVQVKSCHHDNLAARPQQRLRSALSRDR